MEVTEFGSFTDQTLKELDAPNRQSFMRHASATTSIAGIRYAIHKTWPDLRLPGTTWKLYDGNQAAMNSIHIHEDLEILILHANSDTAENEIPILKEYQTWSLQQKRFDSLLRPETMPFQMREKWVMFSEEEHSACHHRPCLAMLIGRPLQPDQVYLLHRGDFLVIMALESLEGMVGAIGHWTMFMQQEPVYTEAFPRISAAAMAAGTELFWTNAGTMPMLFKLLWLKHIDISTVNAEGRASPEDMFCALHPKMLPQWMESMQSA